MSKQIMKGLGIAIGVIIVIIAGFSQLIFGVIFPIKVINLELIKFKTAFEQIPLPENTQKVGQIYSEFGVMGNGNHCDYLVGMLVKSDLTLEELKKYYDNYSLPPADPNETLAYTYGEKKRGIKPVPVSVVDYNFKEKMFVVEGFDQGYEARYIDCY